MTGSPVSFEELLISALATNDALAKLLIDKEIVTQAEFLAKTAAERATFQRMLNPTPHRGGTVIATIALSLVLVAANNDATAYLDQIERRIIVAWRLPSGAEGLKVSLRFNLARNGRVSKLRVEKSSGNESFDVSAVEAVRRASPFPRPPKSFPIGNLRIILEPTNPDRHNENITEDGQTI